MCRPTDARRALPFLFAVLVVALAVGPAAAASGGGEKGGLSFLALERYDLGIFTLIVFGILVFVLGKYAFPKITEGLDKREQSIRGARDEAQKMLTEAQELRTKLQKDLADGQVQVRAMIEDARKKADELRTTEREAGAKEAAAERERARREIEAAKQTALAEIHQQAVDLAALMSAKVIGRQISADDHRRLLDESLSELKHAIRA